MSRILLDHGEGGAATSRLVRDVFFAAFGCPGGVAEDAAILEPGLVGGDGPKFAFTTDTFVVRPLFFPGGDIGRLAVCGTVNDLAVMGATPRWLSAAFILEEGLDVAILGRVVHSMAVAAAEAAVTIVTGDTKVVGRGEADGLFVNTSGVGVVPAGRKLASNACLPGDAVLVSGPVGDHGMAVMLAREGFGIEGELSSDVQPLADLTLALLGAVPETRCLRDPTRGGLATALLDFAHASGVRMVLDEAEIPIRRAVRAAADLLGLDPLFVACEGRFVAVVPEDRAEVALDALRGHPRGRQARRIGSVIAASPGLVLRTTSGGLRSVVALEGAQLPRIC
jgi:hydrogenase expression/formation protein HypE